MHRIIILREFKAALSPDGSFLGRTDIELLPAGSNDELLKLHRDEPAGLIVTRVDAPGMSGEQLCSAIRQDKRLRNVSVIMVCPDTEAGRTSAGRCRANEVLTLPLDAAALIGRAQQLLQVPIRKAYRVLLNVKVEGQDKGSSFLCRSENISTNGLLIETDRHLKTMDKLSCVFFLGRTQVTASGEIVRVVAPALDSNLSRYGIKFIEINEAARAAIEAVAESSRTFPGS